MLYRTELVSHGGLDGRGTGWENHGEAVYIIKTTGTPKARILVSGNSYCGLDKKIDKPKLVDFLVRETGLEPVRCNHTPLKRARLPVPPLSLTSRAIALATMYIIYYCFRFVNSFFHFC